MWNRQLILILFCTVKSKEVSPQFIPIISTQPWTSHYHESRVEGPYGEPTPARYADTAVFIAGGNGIPGIYSEVMDMARRMPNEGNQERYEVVLDYS